MSIKYIFIGNPDNCQEIGHYPEREAPESIANISNQLFSKYVKSEKYKKEERQQVKNKEDIYFFLVNAENIFYLVCGDNKLKEREAFGLIEFLQNKNIPPPLIDSNFKKLNFEEKQQFKAAVNDYLNNNMDKIRTVQIEVDEAKDTMKENLKNMYNNVVDVKDLEGKSEGLKNSSEQYHKASRDLRVAACWQNFKWIIILIVVVVVILLIILPISFSKKKL